MKKYREQMFDLGNYKQVNIYPVFKKPNSRSKKMNTTSEVQQKLNEKNSALYLERLILLNFTENDYWLHLTYDEDTHPDTNERLLKDIQNYIRRVKRCYDGEMKYIIVPEIGSKSGKRHCHIFISGGVSPDVLEDKWGFGFTRCTKIKFGKDGVLSLAKYCTKQKLISRRYITSHNLKRPIARERTGKISEKQLRFYLNFKDDSFGGVLERLYPGYTLCSEPEVMENEVNLGVYACIRLIKTEYLDEISGKVRKRKT